MVTPICVDINGEMDVNNTMQKGDRGTEGAWEGM